MYARIERFNLSQGFAELAEELADQIAPIMRRQPGMQSMTMLSDETSGEYFFVTHWDTIEQIGTYEKSADEWRVRDIMSRHITTVPLIEVYQVHDVPVAVAAGAASAAPAAVANLPAAPGTATAAADALIEAGSPPSPSVATSPEAVEVSADLVVVTREVVVEVSDEAVVTTEVVAAALVEPSGAETVVVEARSVVRAREAGVAVVAPVDGACPATHAIKGNHSSSGDFIYHLPGSRFYDRTTPEVCFATEAEAQAAGFRAPRG